ncbi:MAG: hypothetical protein ACRDFX_00290 [Chloroflexota bacterium]
MYKVWATSAENAGELARSIERHLNEFAEEVISVCYEVDTGHHALVVYRANGTMVEVREEEAVAEAEQIIDTFQS